MGDLYLWFETLYNEHLSHLLTIFYVNGACIPAMVWISLFFGSSLLPCSSCWFFTFFWGAGRNLSDFTCPHFSSPSQWICHSCYCCFQITLLCHNLPLSCSVLVHQTASLNIFSVSLNPLWLILLTFYVNEKRFGFLNPEFRVPHPFPGTLFLFFPLSTAEAAPLLTESSKA